ncbi:hypothetical protein R1sor_001406 [Riccia sorocarpa]|uniref:DUF1995 domain-containing protein n=1 Tax=Riccia sorocarpa TaxID=122646 RepID=A0ABD3GYG4_9MARC
MAALKPVNSSQMSSSLAAALSPRQVLQSASAESSAFPLQCWGPSQCKTSVRNVGSVHSTRRSSSVGRRKLSVRRQAKFQQFTTGENSEERKGSFDELPGLVEVRGWSSESSSDDEKERDDRVLPENLEGAVLQASEATAVYVNSGGTRAIVELIVPDLLNSGEEGDQLRIWNYSRVYLDDLKSRLGSQQMKAIFPDAGVAAMLKYQWKDAEFLFASLNDRKPINIDDDVVVLVSPDYQGLADVERISVALVEGDEGPPRPLVMWNPRLQSGEVGIGLNIRRMREFFLSTFNVVYSMRALPFGAIFRQFPGNWQVFFDDEEVPGRYTLVKVEKNRPILEDIEMLYLAKQRRDSGEQSDEPTPLQNVAGVLASLNRFMKSLSR